MFTRMTPNLNRLCRPRGGWLLGGLCVLLAACGETTPPAPSEPPAQPEPTSSTPPAPEAQSLWQRVSTYSREQANELSATVGEATASMQERAESLRASGVELSAVAKERVQAATAALDLRLTELRQASAENWQEAQQGVLNAYEALRRAYQQPAE